MSLATADEIKQYIGEKSSDEDERINAVAARASLIVTHYCGQASFEERVLNGEFHDGSGSDTLQLKHSPVTAVASVLEFGTALVVGADPSADPTPDVIWYEDGRLVRLGGVLWAGKPKHYKVTYTAGYAAGQVPPPIVQAVLDLAALLLKEKDRIGIQSKTTGQQTTQMVRELPAEVRAGLDYYVRRRAA